MRKLFISVLLIFIALKVFSQKNETIYLNESLNEVKKDKAAYYWQKETLDKNSQTWLARHKIYYMSGNLYETFVAYSNYNSETLRWSAWRKEGTFKIYFPDGKLKYESNYLKGESRGDYISYFPNGELKEKGRIDDFNKIYLYLLNDSSGISKVKNGNGSYCEYDTAFNCNMFTDVRDSIITVQYIIEEETKDTLYVLMDNKIEPLTGWKSFSKSLSNAKFKKKLVRQFVGNQFIFQLIVYEDGKIGKVKSITKVSPELEEEMITEIKNFGTFNVPKLKNGKSVKVVFYLPIVIN
ncbi:MAG: hypothetical protein ABIT08_02560 [Bacteroidia bacterium]